MVKIEDIKEGEVYEVTNEGFLSSWKFEKGDVVVIKSVRTMKNGVIKFSYDLLKQNRFLMLSGDSEKYVKILQPELKQRILKDVIGP